jgi:hypothetical protein
VLEVPNTGIDQKQPRATAVDLVGQHGEPTLDDVPTVLGEFGLRVTFYQLCGSCRIVCRERVLDGPGNQIPAFEPSAGAQVQGRDLPFRQRRRQLSPQQLLKQLVETEPFAMRVQTDGKQLAT